MSGLFVILPPAPVAPPASSRGAVEQALKRLCGPILPSPPTDDERDSYLATRHRRWPFVYLFVAQLATTTCFALVVGRSVDTALALVFLTFMVPPMVVNLWLRVRRGRTTLAEHRARVEGWQPVRWASVDVLLPCCGEDPDVLANTFAALSQLRWPGRLQVHVLDDADQPEVGALARHYGLGYRVRPDRGVWKKAGNLISAFDRTDGEFVVVIDADFVPRSDFLHETLPYFDDPRTGIVQTAQYFDSVGVTTYARYAGALQELFFRWTQTSRDAHGAAICAGTNVVYRRTAVRAAGGFAKVPLGEDVHSGIKLNVAGWQTRYLPLVLAKGLAPDSWSALTNQQYRWCRSSMLLMVSSMFRQAPMSWQQRTCFWAAFLYYMASASLAVTTVLPTIVALWLYPDDIRWWHYLPTLPALLAGLLVFPRLARGWDLRIYRVCMINTFCHVLAVYDALHGRVAAWVPTGAKSGSDPKPTADARPTTDARPARASRAQRKVPAKVALLVRGWLITVQLLVWTGIARAVSEHQPLAYLPAIALALIQLVLLGPLLWRLDPKPVHRAVDRTALPWEVAA